MRPATLLPTLLLALAPFAAADKWDEPYVIKDEESNFEIQTPPDSIDWDSLDPAESHKDIKAHFRSLFADTEPLSYADFYVMVNPIPRGFAKMGLEKASAKWEGAVIGWLQNPRNRKTSQGKLGQGDKTVDCFTIDVQGDHLAGIHHVTWTLAFNGKLSYSLVVQRAYDAVGDDALEAEIAAIRSSFKFFTVESATDDKKARKDDAPAAPGLGKEPDEKDDIDPELLKEESISQTFWRFECVKPEGLVNIAIEQHSQAEKDGDMKLKFRREKPGLLFEIRIFAQTDKARKYTVEQLVDSKIKFFKQTYEGKQHKEPVADWKYDFPMGEKAVKLELIGRRYTTEYTYWYIADCKNERQYQIQIYLAGGAALDTWKDTIETFLEGFKPIKK